MTSRSTNSSPSRIVGQWPVVIVVWFLCLGDSCIRWPIPSANEPHYLAMARHNWDSDWCRNDLFLQSTPAHAVFYQTIGALTRWLSFDQTALLGRTLALLLWAWGWTSLGMRLSLGRLTIIWGIIVYIILSSAGNFSGEWIIRACEAKVFAYGLALLAICCSIDRRWRAAGMFWGLSISFHPLVGIWSILCYTCADLIGRWRDSKNIAHMDGTPATVDASDELGDKRQLTRGLLWQGVLLLIAASLPGIIHTAPLVWGVDPQLQYRATFIQVFYRLSHHLDPMSFSTANYIYALMLIIVWLGGSRWIESTPTRRLLCRFVWCTIALAVVGIIIGWGPRPGGEMPGFAWRMSLLKFYPFRLFDGIMPIATSFVVAQLVQAVGERAIKARLTTKSPPSSSASHTERESNQTKDVEHQIPSRYSAIATLIVAGLWAGSLFEQLQGEHPSRMAPAQLAEWHDACEWIERHTPADALIITPNQNWAFYWYAQRAQYVSLKDCPQDAPHLVEWNRRLKSIAQWSEKSYPDGYTQNELIRLQQLTGADYLLARRLGPIEIDPVYRNRQYRIYQLPKPTTSEQNQ